MTVAKVGRWGSSLAVRIPMEVASVAGLDVGEDVEVEALGGDIVIRRTQARRVARADALAAMAEILVNRPGHTLGDVTVRELIEDGRR